MRQTKAEIDSVSVTRATDHARYYGDDIVSRALNFVNDPRKAERREECECRACHYINSARIGGAAMTSRPCGICDVDMMFGSTSTDVICEKCARENQLCKHCGGDLEMRPRRIYSKK